MLHSPAKAAHIPRMPLEMIFLVDCSTSMRGTPLRKAKQVVDQALSKLTPADTLPDTSFLEPLVSARPEANPRHGREHHARAPLLGPDSARAEVAHDRRH
jgi:hypothetical protein